MKLKFSKLPINGPHCFMSLDEVNILYNELGKIYDKNLRQYNVKFPDKNSLKSLWLIYLFKYKNYIIHKDTISNFVRSIHTTASHDQQVRHLSQDGWYVLNKNEIIPGTNSSIPSGYHLLFDATIPKPTFMHTQLKRVGRLGAKTFSDLIIIYNNRCATCGAEAGKPHPRFKEKIVKLQQAHMNPNKKLDLNNTIPQCQICNQTYKDYFIFDENGYIVAVNNPQFILKSSKIVQSKILKLLSYNI